MQTFAFALFLLPVICSYAQSSSSVSVYKKTFTTYPFSDPDPVPDPAAPIYPYDHFDGYTNQAVQKEWKVVQLENDFIKVMIMPEIGGKIWAATEKKSGKDFIYYNHVVKFRDVAMRGPWTSGGIESNYGTIGHTPNCSTPVDFTTINKPDGSVSCIVGALDLLTRTTWRIEINLPADKAYFTTNSTWYNASGIEQPYYHWMNAGIKAAGNLEFIYPGNRFIGHEGEVGDWPVNKKNKKDVSWYNNNNFGGYKSYHVFGKYTNFFGGYWHDENYGMVRFSDHDDKPGKKLWIWGLSRQGMIWENLLTDKDGQYVEVQSGRLFNQSAIESALTPFKHRGFAPYATDTWTEYWYPVMNTRGYVFANQFAALSVIKEKGWLKLYLSPVQALKETLTVRQQGKIIYSKAVSLTPLVVLADSLHLTGKAENITIELGNGKLVWNAVDTTSDIHRPDSMLPGFDQTSMYGLYLQGKNSIYYRRYAVAEEQLKTCLEKDKGFVPALTGMSMLLYRKANYAGALTFASEALSVNTYDPAANYYYGLINKKLGNRTDAIDGFDIATQSEEYRTPAFTELAKLYFSATETANEKALHYADKALFYNRENTDALQLMAVVYRLQNKKDTAMALLRRIEQYDPLNCFIDFERKLLNKNDSTNIGLTGLLQNEMPGQSYTELALWYYSIGLTENCVQALQLYPVSAETNYWLAFLHKNTAAGKAYYENAKAAKRQEAFPFRPESIVPLQWFAKQTRDWQPVYNLALIEAGCGNLVLAASLMDSCGEQPNDAVFYSARAKLHAIDSISAEADIKKAMMMDGAQWRFCKQLTDLYNKEGRFAEALPLVQRYYSNNPEHYVLGMLLAKTFMLNKRYTDAAVILDKIVVIPYEGATDGHRLYKEAHLMMCTDAMQHKNYKKAIAEINIARQWPERLGVGKPYQEDIDERLENFLLFNCFTAMGDKKKAAGALDDLKSNTAPGAKTNNLLSAWANGDTTALNAVAGIPATDENARVLKEWIKRK